MGVFLSKRPGFNKRSLEKMHELARQKQAKTKERLLSARRKRRSTRTGFVRVHALAEWFDARRVFLSRHKSKRELVSSLRELHPKIREVLEGSTIIGISPDSSSPALVVSFRKKGEIPEEAVSPEFIKLAKREGLGHIIGSERYASVLRVPFKAKPGEKNRALILMLVDEPRLKASGVPRNQVFEELRGNISSWASREPSRREKRIERELRAGPAIPMGPFYKYNAPAVDALVAGLRVLARKSPVRLKSRSLNEIGNRFEVLLKEWAETEAFKGHPTKQFVASMNERFDTAMSAILRSAKYLSVNEILKAIEPSKSLEGIKSSLARAIRRKQKSLKGIQKKEISKVRGKIRARRIAERKSLKKE